MHCSHRCVQVRHGSFAVGFVLLLLASLTGLAAHRDDAEQLAQLIDNVAAFESQYRDVEAEWRITYRHDPEKHTLPGHDFVTQSENHWRVVYQGEWMKELGSHSS
ncbi:MAG TPA: hypothetical protein PKD86_05895 [Gemmatales bacterium]|nr:hypothetical protein [Gemmatales bacterium]HMP58866.1 hypothetical protein [Gemmatales bacterium]